MTPAEITRVALHRRSDSVTTRDEQMRALGVVLTLAVGTDRVSVESKKFLDGEPDKLPPTIRRTLAEAVLILRAADD